MNAVQPTALICSANLTEHAMSPNMELGVLVKGGDVAVELDAHLRALLQNRVVVPLKLSNQDA